MAGQSVKSLPRPRKPQYLATTAEHETGKAAAAPRQAAAGMHARLAAPEARNASSALLGDTASSDVERSFVLGTPVGGSTA
jgi:hypothetical protein